MSVINRFLLLLLSLAGTALALSVLGAFCQLLPEQVWLEQIHFALSRQETAVVAVICLLISVKLLVAVFGRNGEKATSKGEYIISSGAQGEVRVALDAIRSLADRMAHEVHGVRDARVKVIAKRGRDADALSLNLSLVVGREVDIAKLSAALVADIQQQLEHIMSLSDVPVNIVVSDVSDEAPAKKHRVV